MIIKLGKTIFDYLLNNLSVEKPELIEQIKQSEVGGKISIEVNEDIASTIRDWAGDKLQKVGFDDNYELTSSGKQLEEIIDLFYF
jgi:hypothetical protein